MPDFLTFFYPNHDFNLEQGYEFLDKELEELFPLVDADAEHKRRRIDKLIKLFDRTGTERWLLIHVEVQGYRDLNLPYRIFQYFYRILDRYKIPVTTLVILTDPGLSYNPSEYTYSVLDSKLIFKYRTYKVKNQSPSELEKSNNPFAAVILTTLTALRMKKVPDPEKLEMKTALVRQLLQKGFPKHTIRSLLNFIRFYTRTRDEKMNLLFEDKVRNLTSNNETMGVEEMIIQQAEERGVAMGVEQGIEQGIEQGVDLGATQVKIGATKKMIRKGFDIPFICEMLEVTPEFVEKIR